MRALAHHNPRDKRLNARGNESTFRWWHFSFASFFLFSAIFLPATGRFATFNSTDSSSFALFWVERRRSSLQCAKRWQGGKAEKMSRSGHRPEGNKHRQSHWLRWVRLEWFVSIQMIESQARLASSEIRIVVDVDCVELVVSGIFRSQ